MIFDILSYILSLIVSLIEKGDYIGIFLGMTIESSFLPFPSEVILLPAGALIAQGKFNFLAVLLLAILGSLIGAMINYFLALCLGRTSIDFLLDKYGKILFLSKRSLKRSEIYFENKGDITTFIGRFIPAIRQLISLPAGFARMDLKRFALFTSLGAGIWSLALIFIGYFFGSNLSSVLKLKITLASLLIVFFTLVIYLFLKRIYPKVLSS